MERQLKIKNLKLISMSSHHKTFAGELLHGEFKDAWNDFKNFLGADKNLEEALQQGWEKLAPEFKDALVNSSAIVKTIVDNVTAAPAAVKDLIQKIDPSMDLTKVTTAMQNVEADLTGAAANVNNDLETSIANIQAFLKTKENIWWAKILSQAAQTIAAILSPTSAFGQIIQWLEMAYQVFVKKAPSK
jgi:hypothetical protein